MGQPTTVVSPDVIRELQQHIANTQKAIGPGDVRQEFLQLVAGGVRRFGATADGIELDSWCHDGFCQPSHFGCAGRRRRRKGSAVQGRLIRVPEESISSTHPGVGRSTHPSTLS